MPSDPTGKTAVDLTRSGDGLFTVVDLVHHRVLQQYAPKVGNGNVGVGGLLYSVGAAVMVARKEGLLPAT